MTCLWRGENATDLTAAQRLIDQREQDEAFQRAMYRAVRAGKEHPPMIGIWRDERPIGRVTDVALGYSPMTSPAAACEA